jgi:hypothetical protein
LRDKLRIDRDHCRGVADEIKAGRHFPKKDLIDGLANIDRRERGSFRPPAPAARCDSDIAGPLA